MDKMDDFSFLSSLLKIRDCKKDIQEYIKNKSNNEQLTEKDLNEFCNIILLNFDDRSKRVVILQFLEDIFRNKGLLCKLYYFGSTINGIGFYDSDIDIYLQWIKNVTSEEPVKLENCRTKLRKVKSVLHGTPLTRLYQPMLIFAKCPIVKLSNTNPNMGRRPQMQVVDFDLNLSHPLGVFNSVVINFLVNVEPRFKQLFAILKHWAKLNDLIELSSLRSYTLTFLIVFFLQNCDLPYIKSLDLLYEYSQDFCEMLKPNFENELYEKCINLVQNTDKLPSTFTLIHQFFSFYSNFDFLNLVISPRLGYAVRKDHYYQLMTIFDNQASIEFRLSAYLCIEDPFELDRNIASQVLLYKFDQLVRLCSWYASNPVNFLQVGSNFTKFISVPCKTKHSSLPEMQRNICPCFCYTRGYFNELTQRKINGMDKSEDNSTEMHQFICEFAKVVLQTTVDQLQTTLAMDKYKGKFEITQYRLLDDCLQEPATPVENRVIKEEDEEVKVPENVIPNSESNHRKRWINLAQLQLKLLNQKGNVPNSQKSKRKKRKLNHVFEGSSEQKTVETTSNTGNSTVVVSASEPNAATSSNVTHPVVNAVLQCRFVSAKTYFIFYQYDQIVPKWLLKVVNHCAVVCTCHGQPNGDTDTDTESN